MTQFCIKYLKLNSYCANTVCESTLSHRVCAIIIFYDNGRSIPSQLVPQLECWVTAVAQHVITHPQVTETPQALTNPKRPNTRVTDKPYYCEYWFDRAHWLGGCMPGPKTRNHAQHCSIKYKHSGSPYYEVTNNADTAVYICFLSQSIYNIMFMPILSISDVHQTRSIRLNS